jgi:hypothetical protein
MRYLFSIALLWPAFAMAETLVRHCDTPSADGSVCSRPSIWVRSASAINVQVNRVGAPYVRLSDVEPTERIAVCVDDPAVGIGTSTPCSMRVAGRNDLWELKAALYPAEQGPGAIDLVWPPVTTDDQGRPLTDITYRLWGGLQGKESLLASNVTVTSYRFTGAAYAVPYCFRVRAVYQGAESDDSPHACLTLTASNVKPAAPVQLELKSTATVAP